jgi:hypothetical protein
MCSNADSIKRDQKDSVTNCLQVTSQSASVFIFTSKVKVLSSDQQWRERAGKVSIHLSHCKQFFSFSLSASLGTSSAAATADAKIKFPFAADRQCLMMQQL